MKYNVAFEVKIYLDHPVGTIHCLTVERSVDTSRQEFSDDYESPEHAEGDLQSDIEEQMDEGKKLTLTDIEGTHHIYNVHKITRVIVKPLGRETRQ